MNWLLRIVHAIAGALFGPESHSVNRYTENFPLTRRQLVEQEAACHAILKAGGCTKDDNLRCQSLYFAKDQKGKIPCHGVNLPSSEWDCQRSQTSAVNWLERNHRPIETLKDYTGGKE